MAEKISVEIGLEGGAEVERQLENIGKAGQQAFGNIQSAADQVNFDSATAQFDDLATAGQAAFQKVQTAAQSATAFEQIVQGVRKVEGAFEALGNAAGKLATRMTRSLGVLGVAARALGPLGIALGVVGGAFVKFGDDAADALNGLTVAAAKLGQTPQTLDRLQQAFASLGVAADAIGPGLTTFRETLGADFTGNFTAALQQFIGQLERMPDSVERTQLAIQTLGESLGGQVIAGLRTGAISAQNFATALGQVSPATQQQIAEAAQYQQALNQLNAAWTKLKSAFTPITTPILNFLTEEIKAFTRDIKALIIDVQALWQFLKALSGVFTARGPEQMKAALQAVADAYKKLGTGAQQVAQQLGTTVAETGNTVTRTNEQMIRGADGVLRANETVSQSWERRKAETAAAVAAQDAAIAQETAQMQQAAAAYEAARARAQQAADAAREAEQAAHAAAVATATTAVQAAGGFRTLSEAVRETNRALAQLYETAGRRIQFLQGLDRPTSVPFIRPDSLAGGGMIGGHGTGTSDSNLAWVSRGEHIMPARAVAQPGVLSFLEALRRTGGNLRGVLDGMSRFALGGLVPRPAMAFAAGGPVGSMSNVTINFPGTPPISGLRASAQVVDQLQKAAALAQVRSGGRKPSRYS